MKRSKFWTFLFSFCPGAGQMYQGYMKRGLCLISLFILPIVVGAAFMPVLGLASLVVYMYSFFDSLNLKSQLEEGIAPEDDYLVHLNILQGDVKSLMSHQSHLVGWGFVALGVLGLYKTVLEPMLHTIIGLIPSHTVSSFLRELLYSIPGMFVGFLFIAVGLWLVKGSKKKTQSSDDFEGYKGESNE